MIDFDSMTQTEREMLAYNLELDRYLNPVPGVNAKQERPLIVTPFKEAEMFW